MGFMNFGIARWISKENPRKVFAKRIPRPTSNTIPNYSRDFEVKPTKNSSLINVITSFFVIGLAAIFAIIKNPAIC